MREPSPDMCICGGIAWFEADPDAETAVDCADACWKAMIDEAATGAYATRSDGAANFDAALAEGEKG
jgi:hypothetical protein